MLGRGKSQTSSKWFRTSIYPRWMTSTCVRTCAFRLTVVSGSQGYDLFAVSFQTRPLIHDARLIAFATGSAIGW